MDYYSFRRNTFICVVFFLGCLSWFVGHRAPKKESDTSKINEVPLSYERSAFPKSEVSYSDEEVKSQDTGSTPHWQERCVFKNLGDISDGSIVEAKSRTSFGIPIHSEVEYRDGGVDIPGYSSIRDAMKSMSLENPDFIDQVGILDVDVQNIQFSIKGDESYYQIDAHTNIDENCTIDSIKKIKYNTNKIICNVVYTKPPDKFTFTPDKLLSDGVVTRGIYNDGMLTLHAPEEGSGTVTVYYGSDADGFSHSFDIGWNSNICNTIEIPLLKRVNVTISANQIQEKILFSRCEHIATTIGSLAFTLTFAETELPCEVFAFYEEGLLRIESERVLIDANDDLVFITFPDVDIGGVGLEVSMLEAGFRIDQVIEGSPAEHAELLIGEIITAVDGQSLRDHSIESFISLVTGEVGTVVQLDVIGPAGNRSVDLERDKIY